MEPINTYASSVILKQTENLRRELPQLPPDHILGDGHVVVNFPIVHLELEAHKVWQYSRRAGLCFNRRHLLAGFRAHDWETEGVLEASRESRKRARAYGTMCGPNCIVSICSKGENI